ncbi:MAG: adenylate kinase [Gemmatimonadaceae bacterium]
MILLLLGPPGAGKGTQGELLASELGVPKIATGDVLRAAVRDGTKLGKEAKSYMDRGDLVPDEVILGIMREKFESDETKDGAVLDGVVRTVPQAHGLGVMLAELGRGVDKVLLFDIDDEKLVARLSSRTVCDKCQHPFKDREPGTKCEKCGGTLVRRKDDEPEAVRNRLRVYKDQTAPVIEWYEDRGAALLKIKADGSPEEVTERALRALKQE